MGNQSGNLGNLMISGVGSSGGGEFHTVKVDGIGKMTGDLICDRFIINGKTNVLGSIKASTAEINGAATVDGGLRSERVKIHGKVNIQGDLISERLQIHGSASVSGSCETESLDASGRLQLGMLNAGNIQITLHGNSVIREIGGEHIQVRKQPGIDFARWLKVLPIPIGNKLTADTIEGDDVYLEYTTAKVVRGSIVSIGPGCDIGLVEYKAKFDQDKASKVISSEQI